MKCTCNCHGKIDFWALSNKQPESGQTIYILFEDENYNLKSWTGIYDGYLSYKNTRGIWWKKWEIEGKK